MLFSVERWAGLQIHAPGTRRSEERPTDNVWREKAESHVQFSKSCESV
jgi:hypothetical protein